LSEALGGQEVGVLTKVTAAMSGPV
jgi:hypothetical protein